MDTITGMRTFCAVASEESFVNAAKRLGISAALTSKYVGQLEERLGVRLLNRTTRSLAMTETGRAYYKRCLQVIEDFDELEATVQDFRVSPKGHLLISAPRLLGETRLTGAVSEFLERFTDITVEMRLSDRFVNIVEEGFDLAIRAGSLKDSSLIARKLAPAQIIFCASPGYLERHGTPTHPDDLANHNCIVDGNFEERAMWPFIVDGKKTSVAVRGRFSANSANATRQMALKHFGIMVCPDHVVARDIASGTLIPLLEEFSAFDRGIYALYPHNRHLAAKVRVFVDFLVTYFAAHPQD
jgi:DNA-binding transcriptional LysR family regulator